MHVVRAFAVAALGVVAACGDRPTITLRYAPAVGSSFRYALEQDLSMKLEGDSAGAQNSQGLAIRIAFAQTVQAQVDGGTEVYLRVDTVALSSPEISPQVMANAGKMLQGLTTAMVFDSRMQVVSSRVADPGGASERDAAMVSSSLRGASLPLPPGPVRVGEVWTVEMPAPSGQVPGLTKPLMLTSRLRIESFRVEGGTDTIVTIKFETGFPKEPVPVSLEGPGTLQIEGKLIGEQVYSLGRQALVSSNMAGTVRTTTKGAGLGDNVVVVEQRLNLRLVQATAAP